MSLKYFFLTVDPSGCDCAAEVAGQGRAKAWQWQVEAGNRRGGLQAINEIGRDGALARQGEVMQRHGNGMARQGIDKAGRGRAKAEQRQGNGRARRGSDKAEAGQRQDEAGLLSCPVVPGSPVATSLW